MAIVNELLKYKGQRVTLSFDNGEVLDAILIDVEPVTHHDLTYDVLSVRCAVSDEAYVQNKIYVALIATVTRVSPLS